MTLHIPMIVITCNDDHGIRGQLMNQVIPFVQTTHIRQRKAPLNEHLIGSHYTPINSGDMAIGGDIRLPH